MKNIVLFLGEDQLSINKRIKRIVNDAKIDEFNITTYDLEVDSLDQVISDCLTIPFIKDQKAVIVKNPVYLTKNGSKQDYSMYLNYLKKPMDSTMLLINACGITLDEKSPVVIDTKKYCDVVLVKKPSDIELYGRLKMICTYAGVEIKEEAIKTFFNIIGTNDIQRMEVEVVKLINCVGKGGVITSSVVTSLVVKNLEDDVFALTNAIIQKDKEKAYLIYNDLIKGISDTVALLNQVSNAMKNMFAVGLMLQEGSNQNQVASRLNIKSGYAYNLINNVRKLSLESIKKYISELAELDYKIKTGQVNPKQGFEFFLLSL